MFVKIALRNLSRNSRRTAFSLGVITLGVAIMYLVLGFTGESIDSTKETLTSTSGAVQIADADLFNNTATDYDEYLIDPETRSQVEQMLAEDPRVVAATPQLGFSGLIGNQESSTLLIGTGVVPGNPIQDYSSVVEVGEPLSSSGEDDSILITRQSAEDLGVDVGDVLNIATGTLSGSFGATSVTVSGLVQINAGGTSQDVGYVSLHSVQSLLGTDGVERILVKLRQIEQAEAFAQDFQRKLDEAGIPLDVRTWKELNPFYDSIRSFWNVFSGFTGVGVFVLVFFSVLEVLTMSFLERTREVGSIRAIGTHRAQVFRMFITEGVVIGLVGGVLGVAAGVGASALINGVALTWEPPGAVEPVPLQIKIALSVTVIPFLTAVVSTMLSALYPSWTNARRRIVEALSHT